MEKAKRARKAETPKQPSLCLRLRAPYFYPDFAAQWLAYALRYRRFACTLTGTCARLGADAVRYSFHRGGLSPLTPCRFHRRTLLYPRFLSWVSNMFCNMFYPAWYRVSYYFVRNDAARLDFGCCGGPVVSARWRPSSIFRCRNRYVQPGRRSVSFIGTELP
jgi:hypothetical protein